MNIVLTLFCAFYMFNQVWNWIINVILSKLGRCLSQDGILDTSKMSFKKFFAKDKWVVLHFIGKLTVLYTLDTQIYFVKPSFHHFHNPIGNFHCSCIITAYLVWSKNHVLKHYMKSHWELNSFPFFLITVNLIQKKDRFTARELAALCYLGEI